MHLPRKVQGNAAPTPRSRGRGQAVELYNLKDDIGLRKNLAAENPEKVAAMQGVLKKLREQGHSAPRLVVADWCQPLLGKRSMFGSMKSGSWFFA